MDGTQGSRLPSSWLRASEQILGMSSKRLVLKEDRQLLIFQIFNHLTDQ